MNKEELEKENFIVRDVSIAGDDCLLIFPQHLGIKWTENNKQFRSSIWRKDGFPVSLGFRKFTNLGEQPDFESPDLKTFHTVQKVDGSLAIISHYKNQLIFRTRGTVDARLLDNGFEVDGLIAKYPKLFQSDLLQSEKVSILCEWTTPNNVIVIQESVEPELWLLNIVNHSDYSYYNQDELDVIATEWEVKRPKRFTFSSIDDLKNVVTAFKDTEGVVIYSNNDQILKKVKGAQYLALHAFKSEVSMKNLIDTFLEWDMPDYNSFMMKIELTFDFECAQMARGIVSRICDAFKEVEKIKLHMYEFIEPLKSVPRKEAAQKIIEAYGTTNRSKFAFMLLDDKPFNKDTYKKFLFQVTGG